MASRPILQPAILAVACACITPASAASLDDIPNRKPGLWEIKVVSTDARIPPQTIQQCTDASTDADLRATFSPMAKDMCTQQDMQKTATGYSIDATCNFHGIAATSHTEISGDFDSAYTVKVSTTQSGGPPGIAQAGDMTMTATWAGPCKDGQKAGDIIMPGGIKMNVNDMKALRALIPEQTPSDHKH